MRTRWKSPVIQASSGQGLVELALALPVLLLILLGTVDLGRMFFDYIELRNAARESAGYLSRHPDEPGKAQQAATDHIQADNRVPNELPSGALMTVTVNCIGAGCTTSGKDGEAKVETSSTFTPVALGFWADIFGGAGTIPLKAEASMRVLS